MRIPGAATTPGERSAEGAGPVLLAMFDDARLRRVLARMLDEEEFLGPHGIRPVSGWHAEHPHVLKLGGQEFTVECPTGSGRQQNLYQVAEEIAGRRVSIFTRGLNGRRPVHGGQPVLQADPHRRDPPLFYQYFHGDNGAGLGAGHQAGWTGTVALPPLPFRRSLARRITARAAGRTEAT